MITSTAEGQVARVLDVAISDDALSVDLVDGRTVVVPLEWYPRLLHGTRRERNHWRLIGRGVGIHWPDLDEDISIEGLLAGRPSGESQRSFKRWLDNRMSRRPNKRVQMTARKAGRG
jgi:hypothetical protein